ncbi:MAG: RNA-binding transcriptional accessory protein [Acidobacteria bacterium SCN 69-37]|nr:MAG: RNA-binding transcriptional accessory protein [Acidobacteria bacterium SCN 69-37]
MLPPIAQRIATELNVQVHQVDATIALLDDKATVPFIARYRKEATGGLDDIQLRTLEERLRYLRELEERRETIRKSIDEQGKLTPDLAAAVAEADTKARLEDLYLPYKPKRRTKGQMAREAGLEPLALLLHGDPTQVPDVAAVAFVDAEKGVADVAAALDGARSILVETFAEHAELVGELRELMWARGEWRSTVVPGKEEEGAKFSDYFSASEPVKAVPSHRALALLRGRNEGVLRLSIVMPEPEGAVGPTDPERRIAARVGVEDRRRPADAWLVETVRHAWRFKLAIHLEIDTEMRLRELAEAEAIRVFGRNLQDLLLAAPAGQRVTMGLDPGIRTGVKVAVVDGTGRLLDTATVYPHEPRNDWDGALRTIGALAAKHHVQLIAIGNGTASRETDKLAGDLIRRHPEANLTKVVVSEAGASVYSASEIASREFPDVDVSLRGAISIARRLQDPLAELVRIEPKAIGVGQYQHDVSQVQLARALDAVVEDCVNAVGADVNTASAPLLARISGLTESLAKNIVSFRDEHGPFRTRQQLLKVPRVGDRTFQQAAGFLRIMDGENPLDASAVHPEAYPVVERIVGKAGVAARDLIGQTTVLRALTPRDFADAQFGEPTVRDILRELEKPGRDPRPEFRTAAFKDDVHEMKDLQAGMMLEGVVTNVANFGAFVDIGVHQDGLVHVSQLADRFVKDPREVVKAGQIVKVKVVEVDLKRRRISLTMKLHEVAATRRPAGPDSPAASGPGARQAGPRREQPRPSSSSTSMAAAFAKLGR